MTTQSDAQSCIRCDGTGENRGRVCGRCRGDGLEFDLTQSIREDRAATLTFERYQALLTGEMIGLVLGAGLALVCFGNPYIGLLLVLFWAVFHLTARKATRG